MRIILNNNRSKLEGNVKIILKLRENPAFKVRVKGAFFAPSYRKRQWDGYIRFISETGTIETGKVPQLIQVIKELYPEEKINIIDQRESLESGGIITEFNGFKLRDYQREAVEAVTNNRIGKVWFPRGVIAAATNAGKSIISAAIHKTYRAKTLFLLNSRELFDQMCEEMPKFLPGEVGMIASGKPLEWNNFMIVMVQTAKSRMQELQHKLAKYPVVLVDECDLANSKTYRYTLNFTYNSYVRIGLSGSAFSDKRQKEKNERLRAIFGDLIYEIKNKELIEAGWSSKIKVCMWNGNVDYRFDGDFKKEYDLGIVNNLKRNKKIIARAADHVNKGRLPILIIAKEHKHVHNIFNILIRRSDTSGDALNGLRISWVHHERPERKKIVADFKNGKIDILVGSHILKRGKNFPLMKVIINAGGGDSIANVLQILGRATRKHKSKEYTFVDDFYDKGKYLRRHSLHRFTTYKNEKLPIIDRVETRLLKK